MVPSRTMSSDLLAAVHLARERRDRADAEAKAALAALRHAIAQAKAAGIPTSTLATAAHLSRQRINKAANQ